MTQRAARVIAALGIALALAALLRLCVTSGGLEFTLDARLLELRSHRCVSAAAVGAALALSGLLLQAMLRNPLASEYVLGLSAGAGLGVAVATYLAYRATGSIVSFTPPAAAPVLGAAAVLALVYLASRRRGLLDPATLILVGVTVGIVCSALTTLVQHLLPDQGLAVFARWLMGSISDDTPWPRVLGVLAIALACTVGAAWLGPRLDAASLSDDEAASVGLNLGLLRVGVFALASLLTGATLLLAGPIAFIGLICPHLARRLCGAPHRGLAVASSLAGAGLLVLADTAVTVVKLPTGHAPVGVLTALIGGPLFIAMLRSRSVLGDAR